MFKIQLYASCERNWKKAPMIGAFFTSMMSFTYLQRTIPLFDMGFIRNKV